MNTIKLTIPLRNNVAAMSMEVEAEVFGKLCVHEADGDFDLWRVTHIGSGLAFPYIFTKRDNAVMTARCCNGTADWDEVVAAMARGEKPEEVKNAVVICEAFDGCSIDVTDAMRKDSDKTLSEIYAGGKRTRTERGR